MVSKPLYYPTSGNEPQNRDVRLELSSRKGDLERTVLPCQPVGAAGHEGVRRAAVLRRTLRYRRGEFNFLRPASSGRHPLLGRTNTPWLRVLGEALSEVHPPEDVQAGGG